MKHFIVLPLLLACIGCQQGDIHYRQCDVLERCVSITIPRQDNPEAARIQGSLDRIRAGLTRLNEMIHPWQSGGMNRLNARLASGDWSSINPSVYRLVGQSQQLSQLSDGLYNPALYGALLKLWGFDRETPLPNAPSPGAIDAVLKKKPAMSDIELNGVRIRSHNPAVLVQFGTLLDARIIETVSAYLQEDGVSHFLVQARETIYAHGQYQGSDHWPLSTLPSIAGLPALYRLANGESVCRLSLDNLPVRVIGNSRRAALFNPSTGEAIDIAASPHKAVMVRHRNTAHAAVGCMVLMIADNNFKSLARKMEALEAWRSGKSGDLEYYPR